MSSPYPSAAAGAHRGLLVVGGTVVTGVVVAAIAGAFLRKK